MALDFAGLKDRIVAVQLEAFAALTPAVPLDAKPFFWYVSESFPYMVTRGDQFGITSNSEDFDTSSVPFVMRLVIGHLTQPYVGENDDKLDLYIPHLIEYFNERELLQSAAYPTPVDFLSEARIENCTYYRQFPHSGVGGMQVGTEFTLRCKLTEDIIQAYL